MSFDHVAARRALNDSRLPPVARLLWRVLVDYAGQDGRCWPSIETLALDVGVSERHAQRALRELERWGLVSTVRQVGKVSTYTLTPDSSVTPTRDTGVTSGVTPESPRGDTGDTPPLTPVSPTNDTGVTTPPTRVSPEQIKEQSMERRGEQLRAREPDPPPAIPPDLTDSDRETVVPLDLVDRARDAGVFADMASALRCTTTSLEAKAGEFVAYWSIGGGAGKHRRHWMARLRKDLHEAHKRGTLPAPGAVAHGAAGHEGARDPDFPSPSDAAMRSRIAAGEWGKRLAADLEAGRLDASSARRRIQEIETAKAERKRHATA